MHWEEFHLDYAMKQVKIKNDEERFNSRTSKEKV